MKVLLTIIGVYAACVAFMLYEIKHALKLPDDKDIYNT